MKMEPKGNKPRQSLSHEICSSYAPLLLLSSFCFHSSVPLTWLVGWYCFPREQCCTQPISPLAEIAHLQCKVYRTCLAMHRCAGRQCARLLHCLFIRSWLQWGHVTEQISAYSNIFFFLRFTPFFLFGSTRKPLQSGRVKPIHW